MTELRLLAELDSLARTGQVGVLCTVVRARGSVPRHVGSKMLVYPNGRIVGTIGGGEMESRVIRQALEALAAGEGRIVEHALVDPSSGDPGVCGGEVEIFLDPLKPDPTLLVIGGGHVGAAIVHLGKWLGFRVVLSDDRPEFCSPDAVPGADAYLPGGADQLLAGFNFHDQTFIVLPTRGVPVDLQMIPKLLDKPHAYFGVIGSRRRWATAVKALAAEGVSREKLSRINAPMGLELKAETPEEIAVSVLAEIIMRRRGGSGESMKWLGEPEEAAESTA